SSPGTPTATSRSSGTACSSRATTCSPGSRLRSGSIPRAGRIRSGTTSRRSGGRSSWRLGSSSPATASRSSTRRVAPPRSSTTTPRGWPRRRTRSGRRRAPATRSRSSSSAPSSLRPSGASPSRRRSRTCIAAMRPRVPLPSLAIGALGAHALAHAFDPVMSTVLAVVLAYLLLTFFHVVIGELVPKGVALGHSEAVALAVSAPVRGFFILFKPLIWVLQRATELGLHAVGLEPPGARNEVHSEAELKMLLNASAESGEIEQDEQEMLYKVFDFADKEASDVMVPRPEVVALSVELPPEEALSAVIDSPYTRYPVYRESLDDVVGILHVRDLIKAMHDRGLAQVQLEDLVPDAYIVPEAQDLAALLTEFRRTNQHRA